MSMHVRGDILNQYQGIITIIDQCCIDVTFGANRLIHYTTFANSYNNLLYPIQIPLNLRRKLKTELISISSCETKHNQIQIETSFLSKRTFHTYKNLERFKLLCKVNWRFMVTVIIYK